MKRILSYNLNGLRAAQRKGFFAWLAEAAPDIICLQETKAQADQLDAEALNPPGYHAYYHSAEKKGYSGVAIYSKEKPLQVVAGSGMADYDAEGRILRADFPDFSIMSVYVPSGASGEHRQEIKERFMPDFLAYTQQLRQTVPNLIISGDFNIAHTPIDIHDPVRNKDSSGFLPHERAWLSDFLASGFVDSFRHVHPDLRDQYSWWSFRSRARENNKGWRIDYHMVAEPLKGRIAAAGILPDVVHSDHCPISLDLDV